MFLGHVASLHALGGDGFPAQFEQVRWKLFEQVLWFFLKKLLKTFLWKSCQGLPGEGRSVAKFDGWSSKQPRKKSLQQRPALRSHIGQAQVLVGFSYIDD